MQANDTMQIVDYVLFESQLMSHEIPWFVKQSIHAKDI